MIQEEAARITELRGQIRTKSAEMTGLRDAVLHLDSQIMDTTRRTAAASSYLEKLEPALSSLRAADDQQPQWDPRASSVYRVASTAVQNQRELVAKLRYVEAGLREDRTNRLCPFETVQSSLLAMQRCN